LDSTSFVPFPASAERAELETLQAQLADRASTVHFARSAVSLVAALILSAASAKLFWDSHKFPWLGVLAGVASVSLAVFSVWNYRSGKRNLKREMELFQSVQTLRRKLGMDDPSVLLPS
jgi:hypothetical protein